jgi:hypothetical protein
VTDLDDGLAQVEDAKGDNWEVDVADLIS